MSFLESASTLSGPGETEMELGEGGTSVVEAVDFRGERCARKRLNPSLTDYANPKRLEELEDRFAREIELLQELRHPNVPTVLHSGRYQFTDGAAHVPYYVMDFAEESLQEWISSHSPKNQDDVNVFLSLMWQVSYTLAFIHQKGIVHRDVKPENILLVSDIEAMLCDFGLSKNTQDLDSSVTRIGIAAGTKGYAAPEQLLDLNTATEASDIYSFGAVLLKFFLGCDTSSFSSSSSEEVLQKLIKGSEALPHPLRELLSSCLRHSPEDRIQDGAVLSQEFFRCMMALYRESHQITLITTASALPSLSRLLQSGKSEVLPAIRELYLASHARNIKLFNQMFSRAAFKHAAQSPHKAFATEIIQKFVEEEYRNASSWPSAEVGGKTIRLYIEAFCAAPSEDDLAWFELLANEILIKSTEMNRFEGGREFLRCFEHEGPLKWDSFKRIADSNRNGISFLSNSVNFDYLELDPRISGTLQNTPDSPHNYLSPGDL